MSRCSRLLFLLALVQRRELTARSVRPVTWLRSREVGEGQEGQARAEVPGGEGEKEEQAGQEDRGRGSSFLRGCCRVRSTSQG